MGQPVNHYLFQHFSQIDEIAAVETQGLEEREHVGGVPAHRGVDIVDAGGFVNFDLLTRVDVPVEYPVA